MPAHRRENVTYAPKELAHLRSGVVEHRTRQRQAGVSGMRVDDLLRETLVGGAEVASDHCASCFQV